MNDFRDLSLRDKIMILMGVLLIIVFVVNMGIEKRINTLVDTVEQLTEELEVLSKVHTDTTEILAYHIHNLQDEIDVFSSYVGQLEKKIENLEEQIKEQMDLLDDIFFTAEIIRYQQPTFEEDYVLELAGKLVAGARRHEIPLEYVIMTAWAETDFRWTLLGPCNERSIMQVMKNTFHFISPQGDWDNLDEVFEAGLIYLKWCYELQQEKAPDNPNVIFAFYNAGKNQSPASAMQRAWRHLNRIEYVKSKFDLIVRV